MERCVGTRWDGSGAAQLVAPQHMQADVVARRNLGGSVPSLSGDGVDKGSHVRADGTVRRHLALLQQSSLKIPAQRRARKL
jgi:hypothetical protein